MSWRDRQRVEVYSTTHRRPQHTSLERASLSQEDGGVEVPKKGRKQLGGLRAASAILTKLFCEANKFVTEWGRPHMAWKRPGSSRGLRKLQPLLVWIVL